MRLITSSGLLKKNAVLAKRWRSHGCAIAREAAKNATDIVILVRRSRFVCHRMGGVSLAAESAACKRAAIRKRREQGAHFRGMYHSPLQFLLHLRRKRSNHGNRISNVGMMAAATGPARMSVYEYPR